MPELPEVETMRRDLAPALEGATIASVCIRKPDILMDRESPRKFAESLRGCRISSVERRGKNLLLRLTPQGSQLAAVLQVQVRMTGRFAVAPDSDPGGRQLVEQLGFSHVAAQFELDDGRTILYDDVRRLGGFRLLTAEAWQRRERELGPEPLDTDFKSRDLARALGHGRASVKTALVDQRRIAGIGNIYSSEALHRARLDPRRMCRTLDETDMRRLHRGLRGVLSASLRESGTTLRDYRTVSGGSGKFQDRLRVYDREGRSCSRCGEQIQRILQAGRSSYFCPGCQI